MNDTTISVRINRELQEKMKKLDYINWSAILRKSIINELSKREEVDKERIKEASKQIDKLRESGAFSSGKKSGTEIIREWRNKRKF